MRLPAPSCALALAMLLLPALPGCSDDATVTTPPTTSQARLSLIAAAQDIPAIKLQPTERGRTIGTIYPFQGALYLGYGDRFEHTGPIRLLAYRPADGTFELGPMVFTEEIQRFAVHNGQLFTADMQHLQSQPDEDCGVLRMPSARIGWEAMPAIPLAHNIMAICTCGGRLFAATGGEDGQPGLVVSSEDDGATWTMEQYQTAPTGARSVYSQLGEGAGMLFAFGYTVGEGVGETFAATLRDGMWHDIEGTLPMGNLVPIGTDDHLVVASFIGDPGKSGTHFGTYVIVEDRLEPRPNALPTTGRTVNWFVRRGANARLWVLTRDGDRFAIQTSTTFGNYKELFALPAGATYSSIAVHAGVVYLGSREGSLYRVTGLDPALL